MLIPNSDGVMKQFRVPIASLYIAATLAFCIIAGNFFLSAEFFSSKVDQSELEQLRAENLELKDKYEQLRWNLSEVENRYITLVEKEEKIRTLFQLPEIPSEERQLGIGGPASPMLEQLSETEQTALATEFEIDRLLKLSTYELEKYSEVESELQNLQSRLEHTPSIWPTKGWNSRGYGMKFDPFTGYKQMHRGIDIANHNGTPIIATANGTIKVVGNQKSGMGKYVTINHGFGFQTRYGHLSKITVKRGQKVKRGDVIGMMGSTGYSTGPHLHYEVIRNGKFLNPHNYILNDK